MLSQRSTAHGLCVLLLSLIAVACSETSTEPEPDPDVESVSSVTVTATPNPAELTTTVQAAAQVQPAAAPQSVVWTSSDEDIATVDGSGLVTLLLRGTVTITATSTADPQRSGSVDIVIVCPAPRPVTANLSEDTTWENWVPDPECFDYVVQADLTLQGELLTIEPGTVVGFEEGRYLRVRIDAGLNAEGTDGEPIRLTGMEAQRGFWWGLAIENTDHPDNVLAHTTVEYGGGDGITIGGVEPANLRLVQSAVVRIENSIFRQSAAYGVAIDDGGEVLGMVDNTLTENALGPAWVYGTEVPHLNGASLTGNDSDVVVVRPLAISEDASWPSATYRVMYHTQQAFTVTAGLLTLSPGSELRFEPEQSMIVTGEAGLSAVGTAEAPIVFSGTEADPGHWGGLGILSSAHPMNRLDHVVIEYGGGLDIGGTQSERANLVLTHAGDPSVVPISNTTLRGSAGYGLFVRAGTGLEGFTGNVLTENAAGPAYVEAPVVGDLSAASTFSGNSVDELSVRTGTGMNIVEAATWRDLGVPYALTSGGSLQTTVNAALTIEPGVEVLVGPGIGISVENGGKLDAVGTQSDRISMTASAGAWQGIQFLNANGSFDYIDISDAGSTKWGQVDEAGAVTIIATGADVSSTVHFRSEVEITNSGFALVFSHGNSIAVGCPGPLYIPPPDEVADHCKPPS